MKSAQDLIAAKPNPVAAEPWYASNNTVFAALLGATGSECVESAAPPATHFQRRVRFAKEPAKFLDESQR